MMSDVTKAVFWGSEISQRNRHSQVKAPEASIHHEVIINDNKSVLAGVGVECHNTNTANRFHNGSLQTMGHTSQVVASEDNGGESTKSTPPTDAVVGEINENPICQQRLLFDIRNTESDKFMNSIIYNDQDKVSSPRECLAFDLWGAQSKVKFGFILLTDPIMPSRADTSQIKCRDPIELHNRLKSMTYRTIWGHVFLSSRI